MTLRLKPGTKVRANGPTALAGWIGYIANEQSAIPNHERVFFPDLDVTLTFGHDELDMYVEKGSNLTSYFIGWPQDVTPPQPSLMNAPKAIQQDPGDENDYDSIVGPDMDPSQDPWRGWAFAYDNYELHEGEDFVREVNEHGNGFDAQVYVDDEGLLSDVVSFNLHYVSDGKLEEDFIGVLLTPDAAYSLAELLMDAAEKAEGNA